MFQLDAYLQRIALRTVPSVDEAGLRALHAAQFATIPFENLDIHLGRPIGLDGDSLRRKLVDRARGGYCFELNGLLLLALRAIGFDARPILARVHLGESISGRTHQTTLVELGRRRWIVDAGFGAGGPREPLLLSDDRECRGKHWGYRLRTSEPWGTMLQSLERGAWVDSYSFDLGHVTDADIALGHHYTSTSPASHFTTTRVASLPNAAGRASLRELEYTRWEGGLDRVVIIKDQEQYRELLSSVFRIQLNADEIRSLWP